MVNLLAQTAAYAEPALAELDSTLIPGIRRLREPTLQRTTKLWNDGVAGCPELLHVAELAGAVLDSDLERLFEWLVKPRATQLEHRASLTESDSDWRAITTRVRRLVRSSAARRAYREMLAGVWRLASGPWDREGRVAVAEACRAWKAKLDSGEKLEALMPPRHPLSRADESGLDDLFDRLPEFDLSPLYFCLSGGLVVDLRDHVHIAVPASDLLPVRKTRDAMFVAGRMRVLSEVTRVRILLQLLTSPAGAVEISRVLDLSQPTVSGHLKVLREAGLIQPKRFGGRSVMVASRRRIERLIEDARGTIARWD